MADYIYLLQTRLTPAQQTILQSLRELARSRALTLFLVGGAVRDLTSGAPIRDIDIALQGNALKLKKDVEKLGGTILGEDEPGQRLFVAFPGGVRLELGSTLSVTFPKPGKPVYKPATILEDLRRRDFTANAMAISLNEGSYGLLMDPLNGVADLENRELRLVSNYGFIEDPARMVRATRLGARLGWQMEEKTQQRYETGKTEGYIAALSTSQRDYELEEIFHEEDPLRVLRRLESEGWAKVLSPVLSSAKANETELTRLRDLAGQFDSMGIYPDPSAAYFPLLTAKLAPKDAATLKQSLFNPGFAAQIDALEGHTKAFTTLLTSKEMAAPSAAWKLLTSYQPEPILSLAHSSKSAPVQARFKAFFSDWSQSRTRIPYQLMQEMRIVPELPVYAELLDKLFFAIMDGKLDTPEAARAFLEPFSPPAPPPPINLRRRPVKREAKAPKSRSRKSTDDALEADLAGDKDTASTSSNLAPATKPATPAKATPAKAAAVKSAFTKPAANAPAATKPSGAKPSAKVVAAPAKVAPAKVAPVKSAPVKAATPAKAPSTQSATAKTTATPSKAAKTVVKAVAKTATKASAKAPTKVPAKTAAKSSKAPVKKVLPAKPAAKAVKPVSKPVTKKVTKPAGKPPVKTAKSASKLVSKTSAKTPPAKVISKPKSSTASSKQSKKKSKSKR